MYIATTSVVYVFLLLSLRIGFVAASPLQCARSHQTRQAISAYAPRPVDCPSTPLTRAASSISDSESEWKKKRTAKTSNALASWLQATNPDFGIPANYPTLALSTSGGGLRSLLTGAGVHKAFDARESNSSTSGLYQALTYESGLSGGAWLISSLSANNWPTISTLQNALWKKVFKYGFSVTTSDERAAIEADMSSKQEAGFNLTIIDPWGRLLSYQLLFGDDGGAAKRLTDITSLSLFKDHSMPLPIITSLGYTSHGSSFQYEFTPFEFGSWDDGVAAFADIRYLGSNITNGQPTSSAAQNCIENYDNQGYVMGSSSNLFNKPGVSRKFGPAFPEVLASFLNPFHQFNRSVDGYASYPNPFKGNVDQSPAVSDAETLSLVDGGEEGEWNPIWPFLHRDVDVLIVNDNSNDVFSKGYPTGLKLRTTYDNAIKAGLTRMPDIPSTFDFKELGLNKRPTLFGCNDPTKMTILFLPNSEYTYPSNTSLYQNRYTLKATAAMIANGAAVANYGGNSTWGTCLGCGIMAKSGAALPEACSACLSDFCFN